jgi:predicted Rdx family selenoprotein
MLRFANTLPLFRFGLKASWANAEVHRPFDGKVQNVTLIPGIGIGPEITSKKYLI